MVHYIEPASRPAREPDLILLHRLKYKSSQSLPKRRREDLDDGEARTPSVVRGSHAKRVEGSIGKQVNVESSERHTNHENDCQQAEASSQHGVEEKFRQKRSKN